MTFIRGLTGGNDAERRMIQVETKKKRFSKNSKGTVVKQSHK